MLNIFKWLFKGKKEPVTLDEYIDSQIKKGESQEDLKKRLLKDLNEDGPIFKDFTHAIKATPNGHIKNYKPKKPWPADGILTFKWDSCLLKNTCEECRSRHGQIKTMEEWKKVGIPRSNKVCGEKCKCMLLPGNF